MVQQRSRRKVGDNSGVREVRCFRVREKGVRSKGEGRGQIGKVVRGSVTKYRKGTKWKRGARVKGVRVALSKEKPRTSGMWYRIGANGVVVVNKKLDPYANRSRMVIATDRRNKGFAKVLARAAYLV
jgi:ribosomal protein L14